MKVPSWRLLEGFPYSKVRRQQRRERWRRACDIYCDLPTGSSLPVMSKKSLESLRRLVDKATRELKDPRTRDRYRRK